METHERAIGPFYSADGLPGRRKPVNMSLQDQEIDMNMPPAMSRRAWLAATAGAGLSLALAQKAGAQTPDRSTPTERDREWVAATRKYVPERTRLLAAVNSGKIDGPFRPDWGSLQT